MLKRLKVNNFALIQDLEVVFHPGMNVITGETGAGKSILIDALSLAMGKRANNLGTRNQDKKCVVEAVFQLPNNEHQEFFALNDLDFDLECIFRRELTPSGKSRSFINDTPTSLKTVAQLASHLLEIHAQYDNMQLMQSSFTMGLLDLYSESTEMQKEYMQYFNQWKRGKNQLAQLQEQQSTLLQEREFNQYLYEELSQADLQENEDMEVEGELDILSHAEELILHLAEASNTLGVEGGILDQIRRIQHSFSKLPLTDLNQKLQSILLELEDLSQEIESQRDKVNVNPERLQELNDRLASINALKNKHRATDIEGLLSKQKDLEQRLLTGNELDSEIAELSSSLEALFEQLELQANKLHAKRRDHVEQLSHALNHPLKEVGMSHSVIKLILGEDKELNAFGRSILDIQLSSDKGQNFGSLKQMASGGELSRINLIAKSIAGSSTGISCSVLDEIDSGVSGEVARKVGGIMRGMSDNQQLIVITHLAQIASLGHKHFYVLKQDEGKIQTKIQELDQDGRVHEIAKMISGEQLTESAIEQSKSLLNN